MTPLINVTDLKLYHEAETNRSYPCPPPVGYETTKHFMSLRKLVAQLRDLKLIVAIWLNGKDGLLTKTFGNLRKCQLVLRTMLMLMRAALLETATATATPLTTLTYTWDSARPVCPMRFLGCVTRRTYIAEWFELKVLVP